ncbi:MAG: carbohydrate binding domain-containing protein [Clostridia bacterium]|nr:carbohydrate binding domain-containing protein [Clostridia bacterium]
MQKKVISALITASMLCFIPMSYAENANLLKNPSFEEQSQDNLPASWEKWSYTPENSDFKLEQGKAHEGKNYITIINNKPNDARLKQAISVKENSTYKLSAWIKTENVGTGKTGAIISLEGRTESSSPISGTNGKWEYKEVYMKAGSGISTLNLTIGLGGYSNENTGKASFDDIKVEEVSTIPNGASIFEIANNPSNNQAQVNGTADSNQKGSSKVIIIGIAVIGLLSIFAALFFMIKNRRTGENINNDSTLNSNSGKSSYTDDDFLDDDLE